MMIGTDAGPPMSDELKILHVTNAYPCADTPEYGVFIKEQVDSLREVGFLHDVFFINGRHRGIGAYLSAIRQLGAHAKNYDIVHCHHVFSALTLIVATLGRKTFVVSFLNDWTREVEGRMPDVLKKIICQIGFVFAKAVIFKSPPPLPYVKHNKVFHLPNGVDEAVFCPTCKTTAKALLGLDDAYNYVLFVSSKNLDRAQKRHDLFAHLIEHLEQRHPDLRIKRLEMVGVKRYLVPSYFNASVVHVLCSDYEGSPNSVKESLACGTPVISTDVGNVAEMLDEVPHCLLMPVFDVEKASAQVREIIQSRKESERMSERIQIRNAFLRKGITKQCVSSVLKKIYQDLALVSKG